MSVVSRAGAPVDAVRASAATGERARVALALASLYVIWGSTYLAIQVALEGFPPFLMGAVRFALAGMGLYTWLRARGAPAPTGRQWGAAALLGTLMLGVGNGGVAFAEQWVATGITATVIATTPLWAALFTGLFGRWPRRLEWVGLAVGFAGVSLLNLGGELRASPVGAVTLLCASATWGLAAVVTRRFPLPPGLMSSAAMLLAGGGASLVTSLLFGERMRGWPPLPALLAFGYLVVIGSLVAFSAYTYVVTRIRPSLATSYAYVNPVVAVALGVGFAGESVTPVGAVALVVILAGVALLAVAKERT